MTTRSRSRLTRGGNGAACDNVVLAMAVVGRVDEGAPARPSGSVGARSRRSNVENGAVNGTITSTTSQAAQIFANTTSARTANLVLAPCGRWVPGRNQMIVVENRRFLGLSGESEAHPSADINVWHQ